MSSTTIATDFLEPPQDEGELGRLGPYRVVGSLGKGGMGQVYRAEDTRLKRTVALKVMNKRFASTPHSRQRFIDEARSMAAVHHDNVATIFEVGQKDGTPFMSMELLKGETLEAAIASGRRFDTDEILSIAEQTASGLEAAHARGITHRDIKPANLWIQSPDQRIKILDFGLALAGTGIDQLSGVGSVVGTPGYLSPEQARNEPVDDRTDLYALGVVMYELAAGRLPLLASTVASHLVTIICHKPKPLIELQPDVPEPLSSLVMNLLSKEPRDRIPTATRLVAEIQSVREAIELGHEQQLAIEVGEPAAGSTRNAKAGAARNVGNASESNERTGMTPAKWSAVGISAAIVIAGIAFMWMRPNRVAQTPLASTVKPAAQVAPILVGSLQALQLTGDIVGDAEVVQGRAAQFQIQLVNTAASNADDPRVVHQDAGVLARLVPIIQKPGQPKRPMLGNALRFSPRQLPGPGETKTVTVPLYTNGLGQGDIDVTFELQTPAGARVDSQSTQLSVSENLMEGNLLGFETVRTFAGRGADSTIRRGSTNDLGNLKGLTVHRHESKREHVVIRFDLTKVPRAGDRTVADIDRAVLMLTVGSYGHKGRSDLRVYGWPEDLEIKQRAQATRWAEAGTNHLTWDRCPIQDDPGPLTYLGSLEFDNSGDALVEKTDHVRLASGLLDDFIRSQSSGIVNLVLVRENYNQESTRLVSKEGDPNQAPGLGIRWRK